jgi:hypothetical protein
MRGRLARAEPGTSTELRHEKNRLSLENPLQDHDQADNGQNRPQESHCAPFLSGVANDYSIS